jgi:hypothetical protein
MKKTRKTALIAAILAGTAVLAGCDITDDDIVTVYGPPASDDSEQDSADSAEDTVQGRKIKEFRDMISAKYPEADNGNSGGYSYEDEGVQEIYVPTEMSGE